MTCDSLASRTHSKISWPCQLPFGFPSKPHFHKHECTRKGVNVQVLLFSTPGASQLSGSWGCHQTSITTIRGIILWGTTVLFSLAKLMQMARATGLTFMHGREYLVRCINEVPPPQKLGDLHPFLSGAEDKPTPTPSASLRQRELILCRPCEKPELQPAPR